MKDAFRRLLGLYGVLTLLLLASLACASVRSPSTPAPTIRFRTPTHQPTLTPYLSATPRPTATDTATPSNTPTETDTPTITPTASLTWTPSVTHTPRPTPTRTPHSTDDQNEP
jgi:hypothetical protein